MEGQDWASISGYFEIMHVQKIIELADGKPGGKIWDEEEEGLLPGELEEHALTHHAHTGQSLHFWPASWTTRYR